MRRAERVRGRPGGAVLRVMRADLRARRLQAGSVVLVVLLATWLISLGWIALASMSDPFDQLFSQLHGAHLWLYLPAHPSQSELASIVGAPNVAAMTDPQEVAHTSVVVAAGKLPADVQSFPSVQPAIGQLLMSSGAMLSAGDPTGVLLDQPFAETHGLRLGDTLQLVTPSGLNTLRVRGLVLDVNHNVVHDGRLARVFVLRPTLDALFAGADGASHVEGIVGLRLNDPGAVLTTAATIVQRVQAQGGSVSFRRDDWLDYRAGFTASARLAATLLLAFGVAGLLGAGAIVLSLIASHVRAQTRELGMLKALGFTRAQVTGLLVLSYVLLGFTGGLLGLILAAVSAPLVLAHIGLALGVPAPARFSVVTAVTLLCVVLVAIALFAALPAWRAGGLRTAAALRPPIATAGGRNGRFGRLYTPGVLLLAALSVRGVISRPGRAALLLLSLLVGVVMAVFGAGLIATIQQYAADPAVQGYYSDSDVRVSPDFYDPAATQHLIASRPEIASYFTEVSTAVGVANGGPTKMTLYATSGATGAVAQAVADGRWYREGADEVVVNSYAEQAYGLHTGERVLLALSTGTTASVTVPYTVVGVLPSLAGTSGAFTSLSSYLSHVTVSPAAQLAAATYQVTLRPGVRPEDFVSALLAMTDSRISAQVNAKTLPAAVGELPIFVAGLAAALMLIAGVSVLNAMTLTTRERYRELATLKAIGLTPRQVLWVVTLGAVALALVALIVGIPLGLWLTSAGLTLAGRAEGFAEVHIASSWTSIVALALATLVVAVLGAYAPARWAVRLRASEALRYE